MVDRRPGDDEGIEGLRCPMRTHLEIDHKRAFSLGGSHDLENLEILCSGHNKRKSELEFGGSCGGYEYQEAS